MKTSWELIAKYLTSEASESERAELEKWSKGDNANSILLERLKLIYQHKRKAPSTDFSQFQHEDWKRLQQKTINAGEQKVRWLPVWKIAAAISLVIVAFVSIIYLNKQQPLLEIATTTHTKEVWLPDSSYVLLNKDSRLIVDGAYNEETRKVSLIGEGFFKVKSNAKNPFSVKSFGVSTTVLGTQFNVNAKADSQITVSVLEGKVSVVARTQEKLLTANTATAYDGHTLHLLANADPNYLAWKTGIVQFKSKPLSEVVKFLSAHYNKSISIEKNIDTSILITVELNNLSIDQSLEIISSTLDLHFIREGQGYLIK
jgi:ferric-dicitrate binding protein FerR (iron transport regulator)